MAISISFGPVGPGVLDLLCNNDKFGELKQELAIDPDSTLLFFKTEGATDPENYREIVWHGKFEGSRFCRPMSCD